MATNASVEFFDTQFRRQLGESDFALNPFEQAALPHLRGRVLDLGCGLGNLAVAAARQGCSVVALDASPAAIAHLQRLAATEPLTIEAAATDLRDHVPDGAFDTVVAIGLLMFFDCATAQRQLARLQDCLRPGGTAVVNVLVKGTTYLDMFDDQGHCLFARDELEQRFAGWKLLLNEHRDFDAPHGSRKSFATLIARKPLAGATSG